MDEGNQIPQNVEHLLPNGTSHCRTAKSILSVRHFWTKKYHVSVRKWAVNDHNLLLQPVDSSPQHCMGHRLHHMQCQLKLSSLYVQFRLAVPSHTMNLISYGCSRTVSNNRNNTVSCHLLVSPDFEVLQSHFLTFPPNYTAIGHSPVHPVGTADCKLTRGAYSLE